VRDHPLRNSSAVTPEWRANDRLSFLAAEESLRGKKEEATDGGTGEAHKRRCSRLSLCSDGSWYRGVVALVYDDDDDSASFCRVRFGDGDVEDHTTSSTTVGVR